MEPYPRCVGSNFEPYDSVQLAAETERMVCRPGPEGQERKYSSFYATGVYGGIATGYACGCCLRCIFCWVDWSRDFPERFGRFYSPRQAFENLRRAARQAHVEKLRISNSEPTLGREHLLRVLELVEGSEFKLFILETNGILFGADARYVHEVANFRKVHVRVSLKAGTPEAFTRKTGAVPSSFELPFAAIKNLLDANVSFHVAAMSADPRIMNPEERANLLTKLAAIDPRLPFTLEEEVIDPYPTALARLRSAGFELKWPLRKIYAPIRETVGAKQTGN